MRKTGTFILVMVLFLASCSSGKKQQTAVSSTIDRTWISKNMSDAAKQYLYLKQQLPVGMLPRSLDSSGKLVVCNSSNWVSGFYIGTLCYLYEDVKDNALLDEAMSRAKLLEKEQYNMNTHDLGFMMYCSYGSLYQIDPTPAYKEILLNSARSLATRFNEKVGCIRSWGKSDDTTQFRVIIDNMMNLELLMWAFKTTGDSSFFKIATTHANTTILNHFRQDYSSYHLVVYDPQTGEVRKKQTVQGEANESAWARGQSWGLYGFTMMFRETGNKKYLDQANHIAGFILSNPRLPADKVPYWDYDAVGIPNIYRDASAGAVMASALLELASYNDKKIASKYISTAKTILNTLSSVEYKAEFGENDGFLLKHSVGHFPGKSEVDKPLSYADYYYVEAMNRLKKITP